jgi:NADH:ubiquinone oxidoreductase subunit H
LAFNSVLVVDSVLGHLIAEYLLLIDVSIWAIDLFCIIYASIADSFLLLENIVTHATNFVVAKAISTALKFLLCICFLIFARGGIPRYRFDYLTRLG